MPNSNNTFEDRLNNYWNKVQDRGIDYWESGRYMEEPADYFPTFEETLKFAPKTTPYGRNFPPSLSEAEWYKAAYGTELGAPRAQFVGSDRYKGDYRRNAYPNGYKKAFEWYNKYKNPNGNSDFINSLAEKNDIWESDGQLMADHIAPKFVQKHYNDPKLRYIYAPQESQSITRQRAGKELISPYQLNESNIVEGIPVNDIATVSAKPKTYRTIDAELVRRPNLKGAGAAVAVGMLLDGAYEGYQNIKNTKQLQYDPRVEEYIKSLIDPNTGEYILEE